MHPSIVGLVLALTTASVHAERKSLAHGPDLSHARFVTDVPRVASFAPLKTALDVARLHLTNIIHKKDGNAPVEGRDFVFRDDSYFDESMGVHRFFVRQLVNGIEVADGDINLNVVDDHVISFGDSFYRGEAPLTLSNDEPSVDFHEAFCAPQVVSQLSGASEDDLYLREQIILGGSDAHINCNTYHTISKARSASFAAPSSGGVADPRVALLHFMMAAHPSPAEADSIHEEFPHHLRMMQESVVEHSVVGSGVSSQVEIIAQVPGTVNPVPARLVYVQSPDNDRTKLTLAWKFEIEMQDNWYEAYVDASHPTRIHSVIDWASDSPAGHRSHLEDTFFAPIPKEPKKNPKETYNVWAWGLNDPTEGKRTLETGYDEVASPLGWHSIPANKSPGRSEPDEPDWIKDDSATLHFNTTWGNNVFAQENWGGANDWKNNYRPTSKDGVYDFPYGVEGNDSSNPKDYIDLVATQLFYTSNQYHDLVYRYGFDEVSGNFQQHNFNLGGRDGDAVIANAQDGSGYNNANFMTPPDGQNGRMRMYIWNTAKPYRDGDLEEGIVIHELSHGLSTRLTGGPANSGCLGWGEAGGAGEGWGDFVATTVRSHKKYSDYPMGAWAANQEGGIRNYPYSLNETVNPSTYKTLDKPGYWGVHAIGEVWAEMLWVISQRLIKKHGFSETLFPPLNGTNFADGTPFYRESKKTGKLVPIHGNTLMLKLVIDGMKLQPCSPSFFDMRDAIVQADKVLTGGENACDLWAGFAERGLGVDAHVVGRTPWGGGVRTDGYKLPVGTC